MGQKPSPRGRVESASDISLRDKLLGETARISWLELQRFFAQGKVIQVDPALDLVEIAVYFAEDNSDKVEPLIVESLISVPGDEQAQRWFDSNAELWSVVVAPFVLVQDKDSKTYTHVD